jgi:hypothetical protein
MAQEMWDFGLGSSRSGYVTGFSEYDDEFSCSVNGGKFLGQLSEYQLHKKNCTAWS